MLIAYICIAEALMSYNALAQVINPVYYACYLGLPTLFTYTAQGASKHTQAGLKCATNLLCGSNGIFFEGFQLLSLWLNVCLCADLVLTLWSPFTPAANRAKFYYLLSGTITVVSMIYLAAFD